MTNVSAIVAALEQVLDQLGRAEPSTRAARAGIKAIETRTRQVGFLGIAAGMHSLGELLDTILQVNVGVITDAGAALTAANHVPADVQPAKVVAALSPEVPRMASASANAAGTVKDIGAAKSQASRSLKGGAPSKMLALLDETERCMRQAVARLAEARTHTEEVVAEAKRLGGASLSAPLAVHTRWAT